MKTVRSQQAAPDEVSYIRGGTKAEAHSPIYKMHKYFARRPHNVFRHLIEAYTKPGQTVLDPFCGGGVTLVEGMISDRRVVAVDINPLATFVSAAETTLVSAEEYQAVIKRIESDFRRLTSQYYRTACRRCGANADVRWYELAYRVQCQAPGCGRETLLSDERKLRQEGQAVNGRYVCEHCGSSIQAVDAKKTGYSLVSVVYRCPCTSGRQTELPNAADIALMAQMESSFDRLVDEYGLWYPDDIIPEDWDRQLEDCLYRKSVFRFADLFTKRSLFFNAYLLRLIRTYRTQCTPALYQALVFTFSAVLRHTNNMSISAGNWMDGRPASWAKHAYWLPYQFVEVNPIEYLEKRSQAIATGLKYQARVLKRSNRVDSFAELESGEGTHIIWSRSSEEIPIPNSSIDAVITDPPYGSNVQYGELSQFWLVWLRDELGEHFPTLDHEILVHRKLARKGYEFYSNALTRVFKECQRVLKSGGVLSFTFNSKDVRAWYAVIKAATVAGFYLAPEGVVYQEPVENYKNTAHLRFAGSLHGDFIYTFIKPTKASQPILDIDVLSSQELQGKAREAAAAYLTKHYHATTTELYTAIISSLIPLLVTAAASDEEFVRYNDLFGSIDVDTLLRDAFSYDEQRRVWYRTSVESRDQSRGAQSNVESVPAEEIDFHPYYSDHELSDRLTKLEQSLRVTNEEAFFENLVNTATSKSEPYHRWARYREGYAGTLVKELILRSKVDPKKHFVFDPMCGSGSTLVAANEYGFDCLGTDVNPYSVDLSSAKVAKYRPEDLRVVAEFINGSPQHGTQLSLESWRGIEAGQGYFQEKNLHQLHHLLNAINQIGNEPARHLLFVAWLSILEESSDRKKDGNGLVPRPSKVESVWPFYISRVKTFLEDLSLHPLPKNTKGLAVVKSALDAKTAVDRFTGETNKRLGVVIFSPPYANSFDYFESYKLELLLGGYCDEEGLVEARKNAVRNYRKGYGFDLQSQNDLVNRLCAQVRERIPIKESKTGKTDGRTRLVPNLLVGYFDDMETVLHSLSGYMPLGSTCHIVVDQSSYVGVIVPTDLLLADIAQRHGFSVDALIKCRRANTSAQQLSEYPYLKTVLRESIVTIRKVEN